MSPSHDTLEKQFVFIVGAPRSGTTWLHRMVAEHPQVASVDPELTWFSRYLPPALGNFEQEKQLIDAGDRLQGLPILFTAGEFMEGLRELTGIVYGRVLRSRPEATHILDKHPNYANHMGTIARILPGARFIHIIRDGREVAASMVSAARRKHFGASEVGGAAADWDRFTRSAMRAGTDFGPARYMEVRYEQLMRDDGTLLSGIFKFMGIQLAVEEAAAIVQRNAFSKKAFSAADPGRRDDPARTWEHRLTLQEQHRFHRVAGPLLNQLGYAGEGWWAGGAADRAVIALTVPLLRLRRAWAAAWTGFHQQV